MESLSSWTLLSAALTCAGVLTQPKRCLRLGEDFKLKFIIVKTVFKRRQVSQLQVPKRLEMSLLVVSHGVPH